MTKTSLLMTAAAVLVASAPMATAASGDVVGTNTFRDGLPEITFCGASKSGNYTQVVGGNVAAALEGISNVTIVTTDGTPDIINMMGRGECDIAAVQADGLVTADIDPEPITVLYPEYAHFMCHKDSGIGNVKALLSEKPAIAIGKATSGSATTWRSLAKLDPRFADVPTSTKSGGRAAAAVMSKEAACILSVTGLRSDSITKLGARTQKALSFTSIDPDVFKGLENAVSLTGDPLYREVELDEERYKTFTHGFWGDPNVLAVDAILVASENWLADQDEDVIDDVYSAVLEIALPNIRAAVGYVPGQ